MIDQCAFKIPIIQRKDRRMHTTTAVLEHSMSCSTLNTSKSTSLGLKQEILPLTGPFASVRLKYLIDYVRKEHGAKVQYHMVWKSFSSVSAEATQNNNSSFQFI